MTMKGFIALTSVKTRRPMYLRVSSVTAFGADAKKKMTFVHVIGGDHFEVLEEPEAVMKLMGADAPLG